MPIQNTPRFGPICDVTEQVAAGSGSASSTTRPVTIGAAATTASPVPALPATLSPGTAASASVNVLVDGTVTLGASASLTIDLTTFASFVGTKTLAKCRGWIAQNNGAAELGATAAVSVSAGATNGFTAGGSLPASGSPIVLMPNSAACATNLNIAGWTVDGTHKTVTFTAGSAGATFNFAFIGE